MSYDKASWHYGGTFPADLPPEAGATHIGMFVAWAVLSGLAGDIHTNDGADLLKRLRDRTTTPGQFLIDACDEVFTDDDLNDEGNDFARDYYDSKSGRYFTDYQAVLGAGLPDIYHAADTWKNFDRLKPTLDQRHREWKARR